MLRNERGKTYGYLSALRKIENNIDIGTDNPLLKLFRNSSYWLVPYDPGRIRGGEESKRCAGGDLIVKRVER